MSEHKAPMPTRGYARTLYRIINLYGDQSGQRPMDLPDIKNYLGISTIKPKPTGDAIEKTLSNLTYRGYLIADKAGWRIADADYYNERAHHINALPSVKKQPYKSIVTLTNKGVKRKRIYRKAKKVPTKGQTRLQLLADRAAFAKEQQRADMYQNLYLEAKAAEQNAVMTQAQLEITKEQESMWRWIAFIMGAVTIGMALVGLLAIQ